MDIIDWFDLSGWRAVVTERNLKSSRMRFSLWTLPVAVAILGIALGCIRWMAQEAKRQKGIVASAWAISAGSSAC